MAANRITQKEIAAACGVSVQAVSLALQGKPGVSNSTADRIRSTAKRMGYSPDPVLSSLVRYRQKSRPARGADVIAYVHTFDAPGWPPTGYFKDVLDGLTDRAKELGYRIELFGLDAENRPEQLNRILINRGIRLLIFAPQPWDKPVSLEGFDLDAFTVFGMGSSWHRSGLPIVAPFHFQSARRAVRELQGHGCRRIALILVAKENKRDRGQYTGGFISAGVSLRNPRIFLWDGESKTAFFRCLDRARPDGLVADGSPVLEWSREWMQARPSKIPLACLRVSRHDKKAFGIDQRAFEIGAQAAEEVHSRRQAGIRGLPTHAVEIMMPGIWIGASSPKVP